MLVQDNGFVVVCVLRVCDWKEKKIADHYFLDSEILPSCWPSIIPKEDRRSRIKDDGFFDAYSEAVCCRPSTGFKDEREKRTRAN